jgi:hypothetical protein
MSAKGIGKERERKNKRKAATVERRAAFGELSPVDTLRNRKDVKRNSYMTSRSDAKLHFTFNVFSFRTLEIFQNLGGEPDRHGERRPTLVQRQYLEALLLRRCHKSSPTSALDPSPASS